jgi:hypothetical protein
MVRRATPAQAGLDGSESRAVEPGEPQSPLPVKHALDGFYPLSDSWLRSIVANFWWIQLGLVAVDAALFRWLGTPGLKMLLILAPHVFVGVAAVLAYRSLERLRDHVLRRLWEREVITTRVRRHDPMRREIEGDGRWGLRSRPAMRPFAVDLLEDPGDRQYAVYISRFHRRLNGWWAASVVGGSFALAFYTFYVALGYRWGFPVAGLARAPESKHLVRWLLVPDLLVQAGLAFVVGVVAWRLVVVAWELWHLAGDFDFRLQLQHPDKSAGLGPLGDICFSVAAVWGVAAIYPTVWLLILTLGEVRGTGFFSLAHLSFKGEGALKCVVALREKVSIPLGCPSTLGQAQAEQVRITQDVLHGLTFYVGGALILTFLFAVLTFYVPLYFIHRGMERQRSQLFPSVDRLGRRIGELTRGLGGVGAKSTPPTGSAGSGPSSGNTKPSEDAGEAVTSELTAAKEAYDARSSVPQWPFDGKVLGKFVGSTVIPLTGLTTWLPALIGKSFGA